MPSTTAKDYICVREAATTKNDSYCQIVDEKPYFPFLFVTPDDEESIKHAVMKLVIDKEEDGETKLENGLTVEKVSGGITNQLYKVSTTTTTSSSSSFLVRLFGAEGMINRDTENSCYAALSNDGHAPPYYGRFANGRIEGYLDMRTMETHEMGNYTNQIAEKLAALHKNFSIGGEEEVEISLWTQLFSWLDQAMAAKFSDENNESTIVTTLDLESILSDLKHLQKTVLQNEDCKTSFCHNDILAANVLVSKKKEEEGNSINDVVQLIDFEYGGYNYAAFDIANHFNEYAGGTSDGIPDYTLFPSHEKQQSFIRKYLSIMMEGGGGGATITEKDINKLHQDVEMFVLINHLYWGVWAVNQAYTEGCDDFNYLLYAQNRIGQYRKLKKPE